jgi:hypothetical protein
MTVQTKTIWDLVWGTPQIDPDELAAAVVARAERSEPMDTRTRLLIRDSVDALEKHWGATRLNEWLRQIPARETIEAIWHDLLWSESGFPSIGERLMEKTDPEVVQQMLRELGARLRQPVRIEVGGSIALILPGYLSRSTEDIDVVDELPESIRSQHKLLDELRTRYGLYLAHFQSHYLPSGWHDRVHYFDTFGAIQVYLVDVMDVFLSKLFSIRSKDLDDMRMLAPQLNRESLTDRLKRTTVSMLASESLRQRAEQNWYILFGEKLPYVPDTTTSQGTT